MYFDLGDVVLKDGQTARAAIVRGPDAAWAERVQSLLGHKGDVWQRQVSDLLDRECGVRAEFAILHRDGAPFANIMAVDYGGVGVLGHVFTAPEHRGQGAASLLMGLLLERFRARGGRALYLSTGFDSSAYRIYFKHGFRSVEPGSGVMCYSVAPQDEFEHEYFAPGETSVVPISWPQWASSSALFAGDFPGVVRNAALRLMGRDLTEEALLFVFEDEQRCREEGQAPRTLALQKENGAVVGLASWRSHPLWPGASLLDVYCHSNFWNRAAALLAQLGAPDRVVAYADVSGGDKERVLEAAGLRRVAVLPAWISTGEFGTERRDVAVWSRP